MLKIGIVGNGVVGHATARAFMEHAEIKVYDVIAEKRTHTLPETVACDLVFVCLPTPQIEGQLGCNLRYLHDFFEWHRGFNTNFILRSTVPIGTTKKLARVYNLPNLVHSPEFLTARCAVTDAQLPARNIIGTPNNRETCNRSECEDKLWKLYTERFPGVYTHMLSSDESEAVKLFQNSFFAVKVGLFNEFKALADTVGMDWEKVLAAMLADGRIAHSHTKVPGPDGKYGFGGTCLLPNTRITLADGSWVPIDDIYLGDSIQDRNGVTIVTGVATREVDELVTLKARGREVTGSIDHIHLVEKGGELEQRLLRDVLPGDKVFLPKPVLPEQECLVQLPDMPRYVKAWKKSLLLTPDLAWAIGLWLGDGYKGVYGGKENRKGWQVGWTLGEHETALKDRLISILEKEGLNPHCNLSISKSATYGESRTWAIRVKSAWFYYFMDEINLGGDCYTKRAPILNENLAQSLIGGWLDADGCYSSGTIEGHSESTDLIYDLDRLLMGCGVCPTITFNGKRLKVSLKDDVRRVCSWTQRHKFDDTRYVRQASNYSPTCRALDSGWLVTVQSVERKASKERVVSIETQSGEYIANSQLTHNCLPKDLANLIECMYNPGNDITIPVRDACFPHITRAALERNKVDRRRGEQ